MVEGIYLANSVTDQFGNELPVLIYPHREYVSILFNKIGEDGDAVLLKLDMDCIRAAARQTENQGLREEAQEILESLRYIKGETGFEEDWLAEAIWIW